MSESKGERRGGRREKGLAAGASAVTAPTFTVVASGENVVLVNTHTGQTWAMASDNGHPIWHPVAFESGAARAPRRPESQKDEED